MSDRVPVLKICAIDPVPILKIDVLSSMRTMEKMSETKTTIMNRHLLPDVFSRHLLLHCQKATLVFSRKKMMRKRTRMISRTRLHQMSICHRNANVCMNVQFPEQRQRTAEMGSVFPSISQTTTLTAQHRSVLEPTAEPADKRP